MSYYDTSFDNFSVATEQQQPTPGYDGVDPYYSHDASGVYGSNASLVLRNDGRAVRSTPGMASPHMFASPAAAGGDRRSASYSDQQLPLSVYSDHTMTIDDHMRYNSAFMSSNAPVSLVSPGGHMEEHPNMVCNSRNAQRQRLHDTMSSDPLSSASIHTDLSESMQSDGADVFSYGHGGNLGVAQAGFGHMVTGIGGGVDNGGGGFTDTEFHQLMEQICSPDAGGDPLLPQCSPVAVYSEDASDLLRRVNVDQQLSGGEQLIQDLEAFQATDIQFQQSATIYGDFLKAPVQVHPAEGPSSEPRSQTLNSLESEPLSIEHDLEIMTLMRTKKAKKSFPPQTLALSEQTYRRNGQEENIAVTTCTPAQMKTEFVSPTQQVPDFTSLPQTPLSSKPPYGVCSQPPMTPVQVSAPSPAHPQTPSTPLTPSPPLKKGPYEMSTFHKCGRRCLSLSIRTDIPEEGMKIAYQANVFSYQLSRSFKTCLDRQFELNMALNTRAKMCDFEFDQQTGQMLFSMPSECMQLDKWLSVHQGDEDLLERQMVVQQVANFLADIHGCGSADKLNLWGSFVVWVTPDTQVYILVDYPDMLTKMEREQLNHGFDARVEDVKALYKLYKEIFEPHIKQGSSWISPGVTNLLQSFETLLCDPTSVYRMAELARMLGERRLCKLEVDIMSLVHTTYCIEHEKLNDVLSHFREMLPSTCAKWQVLWSHTRQPVGKDVVAVAQKLLKLQFAPVE